MICWNSYKTAKVERNPITQKAHLVFANTQSQAENPKELFFATAQNFAHLSCEQQNYNNKHDIIMMGFDHLIIERK
jgi:hypothetical protein